DNDGYSLAVTTAADGTLELAVRVSDAPLSTSAAFPTVAVRDSSMPAAPDRDAFARRLVNGCTTQSEAVRRVLSALAAEVAYDSDRLRPPDPRARFPSPPADRVRF